MTLTELLENKSAELDRAYQRNKEERATASSLLDQLNAAQEEIRQLRNVIEDAPHACDCRVNHWRFGQPWPCTCWKSKAESNGSV